MSYEELKQEFIRGSFREEMVKILGCACGNCGSEDNIEYHHIVPLKLGGSNRYTNIVPLCHKCHMAAHTGRNVKDLKDVPKKTGRPRKWVLNMKHEMLLWMFARGEIGMTRFREQSGFMNRRTKLQDTPMYKDFLEKHNIEHIRNLYDIVCRQAKYGSTHVTSIIYYKNGRAQDYKYTFGDKVIMDFENREKPNIVHDGRRYRYDFA